MSKRDLLLDVEVRLEFGLHYGCHHIRVARPLGVCVERESVCVCACVSSQ
jgi:hypothetical protein